MKSIQIHARAENGHVAFDLPAEYASLSNSALLVTLVPEAAPTADTTTQEGPTRQFPPTDWAALEDALAKVQALNPYRDIADPMKWQRDLRDEWERPLPSRP